MNQRSLRIVVGVAAAFALVFGQATRTLAASTGELSGHVTDAATHAPVAGARVTAISPTGKYTATTRANGFYAIVNVFPDTYTVTASAVGYEVTSSPGNTVNQEQNTGVNLELSKQIKSLGQIAVRGQAALVQPNTAPDQYTLNAAAVNSTNGSGGSYGLYQTPGVIGTLPGVTLDAGGYSHIRGGRFNEVGYEYDGITTVEPITDGFSTNLVNDGLARIEVTTGGYSASGGNAISGIVNTVVGQGSYPGSGSVTLLSQAPTYYHGINFDYGSATPNGRFSYYLSGVYWNSGYDWARRGSFTPGAQSAETAFGGGPLGDVIPSRDQVVNLHYKFGQNNENDLQYLATTGIEHYDNSIRALYYPSTNPATAAQLGNVGPEIYFDPATGLCADTPTGPSPNGGGEVGLFPGQKSCAQGTGNSSDHDDQGYFIDKLQLTHNFNSSSFINLRYALVGSFVTFSYPFGDAGFGDFYETRNSNQHEVSAEYTTQLNSQNLIKLGGATIFSKNALFEPLPSSGYAVVEPANNHDANFFASDTFKPNDKLTFDISGRYDSRSYDRLSAPKFTDRATQGRFGFAWQSARNTVIRGSYGNFARLPDTGRVERIFTLAPNYVDISGPNQLTLRDAQPAPTENHSADLSVEHDIGDGWSLKVSPFLRTTTDLILTFKNPGQPAGLPQAVGPYYVNGLETEVQLQRPGNGWSGYIDYTHTRALSSVTGDFNQALNPGDKAAHALYPVSFVPPNVANLVANFKHDKWTFNPVITYVDGYPYGVGRIVHANTNCPGDRASLIGPTLPACGALIPNAAQFDANGNVADPAESTFSDGRTCCSVITANLNVYYNVTRATQLGIQWQNLNKAYSPLAVEQNPYFTTATDPSSGFNGFLHYGQGPYIPASINNSQEFLFTVTTKLGKGAGTY
ncbi:MAG: TonB-dependent receptor [Candidatus Eremiobacteraeota bacterium]|nr:TonB-dependent receptor [Candidatus Eremiobacteraeota bacterium]MBC5827792.1 TonB-dependent receptor [Candidatus Eremiobacteraeota bacterium]